MIYYLSRSPKQAAHFLNDNDAKKACGYSLRVITNALQLHIAESIPHLPAFDLRYATLHMVWCSKSIDHMLWAYEYHLTLQERINRSYALKHDRFMTDIFVRDYVKMIPYEQWEDPPINEMPIEYASMQIDTITKWRLYYSNCRKGPYKKVKPPFWLADLRC